MTFDEPADAFRAIERAKEDPVVSMYDVGFGGRRVFCGQSYADLGKNKKQRQIEGELNDVKFAIYLADNVETEEDIYGVAPVKSAGSFAQEESFESLLQSFKRKVLAVGP